MFTGRVVLAATLCLAACDPLDQESDQESHDGGLITDAGLYELMVEMEPDPPTAGDATLTVMVHDADSGDMLMGSTLEVTPMMPQHGHGVADPPLVVEDAGIYTVTFAYSMPGDWELTFDVSGELGDDSLVMDVEVQ